MSQEIVVTNPATGEEIGRVKSHTLDEGIDAIKRARAAQKKWSEKSIGERIKVIKRFQHALAERSEEVCELIAKENGKPLTEAMTTEVIPVMDLTAYFCKRAEKILQPKPISMHLVKYRKSYLHYEPRGVLFVISPWNFPFTIPTGEIVMALLAGNAVVHKPASITPLIALKCRELFDQAGLDPDLYQVLPMPGGVAFDMIKQGVNYVNFTGSTGVGERVSAECGRLLIPCSMELGGKDPMIVCDDANIDAAVGSLVWGGFANAGQVCASVERAYVHEKIYDDVLNKVVEKVKELKVGNPLEDGVQMGPMTDPGQLKIVIDQVEDAKARGAKIHTGGSVVDGPGQFYLPTVLSDVTPEMRCIAEETFGPTLPFIKYSDDDDAVRQANDSEFGLNAYVFSADKSRAKRIAEKLEAGTVMVNEVLVTHGFPETPWQGVKKSGVGRVHSDDGLKDLCVAYHVNYDALPQPAWSPFWQSNYGHKMFKRLAGLGRLMWGPGLLGSKSEPKATTGSSPSELAHGTKTS
ncbi:MAG: aldehyde dehydrogenase family protein [Deltaproteobacteria bacterium]|nr:aldehyde dehydrogenase family protein [Deltaproteobacteria bacterium]MCB9478611.1 aldehyde dehydrogenase family protein [Deltaproteobacteria bacterium]